MRPRGRHLAPSLRRINRSWALPLALAFSVFLASVALADNLEADGDAVATNLQAIAFGQVCPGSVTSKTAKIDAVATGRGGTGPYSGQQIWENGAELTVTRTGLTGPIGSSIASHLSVPTSVGSFFLPSDWQNKPNNTRSSESVTSDVEFSAPENTTTSSVIYSGSITYSASGAGTTINNPLVTRTAIIQVSATVLPGADASCAQTSTNNPPTADAGGPYTGDEGSAIALDGTGSFDPDTGDTLTYAWTVDSPLCSFDNATGAEPKVTCTDNGTFTVTLTVEDGKGGSDTNSASLTIENVAPSIETLAFGSATAACGTDNAALSFTYSDPGSNDTHEVSVDWGDGSSQTLTGSPASHTYGAAGMYTATLTVSDDDGGADTGTASMTVNYTIVDGGVLPPIKADGSSVFKLGSTVPVKVRMQDCNGSYPGTLVPKIQYQKVSGNTPGGLAEPLSTSGADTTGVMRFTGAPDNQYIYNLSTRSLPDGTATYRVVITIPVTRQTISSASWGVK